MGARCGARCAGDRRIACLFLAALGFGDAWAGQETRGADADVTSGVVAHATRGAPPASADAPDERLEPAAAPRSPVAPPSGAASPNGEVPPTLTINEAGLFDVHLRDVALSDALRLLSQRSRRNISVSEAAGAKVTTDLYQVTFDEALDALLTPAGLAWFSRDRFIFVCRPDERDALLNASRATELRTFELNFIAAREVVPVVTKLLSPKGLITHTIDPSVPGLALTPESFDSALSNGLGGKSRAVGEFLVVRDYPEVLAEIAGVVARLDARPRQVMVEATILRARLNENNALGVDFNALAGVDFRTLGFTSVGGVNRTPGAVPPREFDRGLGAVQTDVSAQLPAGGLSVGVMTNNVGAFIRALEEAVDVTIVANPKILTLNEQPGRVIVGREDGYQTTTVTETAAVQNIEFIQTGTQILFRPFIGSDGFVRMDIHPEDSSGGLTPANLPFKDTTEVTSSVLVRDGHTLVIGGLFREVTSSRTQQIPWFGNLPGLGLLGRGKNDEVTREEVIVLLTPHIVDGAAASGESARLRDEVERRRTLAHRALLPWGRERLAQAHYGWALEHERAGRTEDALWDLDLALWMNPGFTEADELRQRLRGAPTREPDNSVIRHFLRDWLRSNDESAAPTGA
ncbi:MAG: type II secretion system protein GspD [Phycisphaerae bacterium]